MLQPSAEGVHSAGRCYPSSQPAANQNANCPRAAALLVWASSCIYRRQVTATTIHPQTLPQLAISIWRPGQYISAHALCPLTMIVYHHDVSTTPTLHELQVCWKNSTGPPIFSPQLASAVYPSDSCSLATPSGTVAPFSASSPIVPSSPTARPPCLITSVPLDLPPNRWDMYSICTATPARSPPLAFGSCNQHWTSSYN